MRGGVGIGGCFGGGGWIRGAESLALWLAGGERLGVVVGWELALGQMQLRGEGMR